MRVIAGEFRSRKLESVEGMDVRPTPDRMREALFNILQGEVQDAVFVDAYAGTGSVGIEALSRGARNAVFIEKDRRAVEVIQRNLAALKIGSRARVIRGYAAIELASFEADIVFADPPYPKEREYSALMETAEAHPPGLLILQHPSRFTPPGAPSRIVRQGDNALSFYRAISAIGTAMPGR